MATRLSPQLLHRLLRYEPGTGRLFWRERTEDLFLGNSGRSAQWKCRAWNAKNAGKEAFTAPSQGYRVGVILDANYPAHQVIWAMVTGKWVPFIDHQNGRRSENRIRNLRKATRQENQRNHKLHAQNQSGVMGVGWDAKRRRWRASITVDGRQQHLGRFRDMTCAVNARLEAEKRFGFHVNHGRMN